MRFKLRKTPYPVKDHVACRRPDVPPMGGHRIALWRQHRERDEAPLRARSASRMSFYSGYDATGVRGSV
jgi:hypothetical protein